MNTAGRCKTRKSWGIRPKGYPTIAAPAGSYAVDSVRLTARTGNLPLPRQTALRSGMLRQKYSTQNSARHAGVRTLA